MEYEDFMNVSYIHELDTGERKLHVSLENVDMSPYEKEVVLGNQCKALLGMRCISDALSTDIFYSTEGLVGLREYVKQKRPDDIGILKMMTEVLDAVVTCADCLIFPDELALDGSRIYFNPKDGRARLLYVPCESSEKPLGRKLCDIYAEICDTLGKEESSDMHSFFSHMSQVEGDAPKLLKVIEEKIRSYNVRSLEVKKSDIRVCAINEEGTAYKANESLKSKLRNIINELVS